MNSNLQAKLEALLFLYGEPMKIRNLAKTLEADEDTVSQALSAMNESYKEEGRGLFLIVQDERVMLTTKPDLGSFVQSIIKEELDSDLTPASLETISIIAYLGPCTRAEIDYVRGVNSSFILRNLAIRGLIERHSDPKRSNAILYDTSFDFMKHIGVSSKTELPDYEKFQELSRLFRNQDVSYETKS